MDERILRAPTPPPLLGRRRVPMPARSLQLEPVAPEQAPHLSGPVLDQYVRAVEGEEQGVPVLRDLPFGDMYAAGDTPFFMDDSGDAGLVDLDDGDTEGIPVGLPDLLGFSDLPVAPVPPVAPLAALEPSASVVVPAPVGAAPIPWIPVAVALAIGALLGVGVGVAIGLAV